MQNVVNDPSSIIWRGIDALIIFGDIANDKARTKIGLHPTILFREPSIAESEDALSNAKNKEILIAR